MLVLNCLLKLKMVFWDLTFSGSLFPSAGASMLKPCLTISLLGTNWEKPISASQRKLYGFKSKMVIF